VGNTFFLDYGDSPTPIRYDSPKTRPLRGGYSDISAIPILSSISIKVPAGINSGPQRNSLMEDLVYFWKSQQLPFRFNINDPDMFSISYFGLRIASSEWLCFLSFIQDTIETFEKSLEGEHPEEDDHMRMENNLASLQKMKRRFNTFNSDINATIATFKSHLYLGAEAEFVSAMELDFREIAARLSTFQQRVEGTLPVVTALVQIHDGRRSYQETTNLTRLTYLALTFVPLSFCSSLFSMSEGIAPGGPRFWIYFAVAIPLLLLTFAIVFSHSFDFRQVWSRVSVSLKKVYS
jgi:hypothetical protein